MSFRQPEFRPRNALAEYAQVQQIVGGQRQTEIADMQMEDLRRERGVLGQIAAAISAKGGPDLRTASLLMMQNPRTSEQGYNIYQALQKQQLLDEYERRYGGGAGAPTTPTSAAGAITGAAPAAAEPVKSTDFDMRSHVEEKGTPESPFIEVMPYESSPTSTQRRAQGKSQAELRGMLQSESESGRPLVRYINPMDSASGRVFSYSMPTTTNPFLAEPLPPFEPTSEPAPAAVVQTNALAPTAPPANLNQLAAAAGAAPNIDALRRQYNLAVRAGSPDAAVLLKQIENAMQSARSPDAIRKMRELGIPITEEGFARFSRLSQAPQVSDISRLMQERDALIKGGKSRTDADVVAIQKKIDKLGTHAPPTQINLTNVQEKAERGKFGELLVKQYEDISKAAGLAAKTLPALDTQAKILDQGFSTGFGTEVKKAGASVLAALGVPEAEKFATDAQTFLAATQQAVLQRQLEQKGPQTEADAQRITQTGAQLGNTVNANRFIIDVAKAQLKRDIEQRNFYNEWRRGPGKNSFDGAEDAWFSGPGGKSLFDRPELKKYVTPAAAQTPSAAPAIPQAAIDALKAGRGTDEQFDAIFGAGAAKRARGQ
jgi:hypothetical protein